MSNIYQMNRESIDRPGLSGGTEKFGGDDGGDGMNRRIQKLEEDVGQIKTDVIVLRSTSATEATLHKMEAAMNKEFGDVRKEISGQTKWIASIIFAALALGLTAAKLLFH
ncbi:hypothetical protein AAQ05_005414 [Salmonella enterica subsp. diarizonae]|nr:hypothetical protein [Salmonella enterica subsp. diarizonae]